MNGRIYDPQLGRFLSADPIVQFPTFLQSYNRYSYVLNNPATYNDPSGHAIPAVAAAIIAWILAPTPDDVIVTVGVSTLVAKTYFESTGTTPGDHIEPGDSPFDPDSQEPPDSAPVVDVPDQPGGADKLIPDQESPAEKRIDNPAPRMQDSVDPGKSPAQDSNSQSSDANDSSGSSDPENEEGTQEPGTVLSEKINKQMEKRGWSISTIENTIATPVATSPATNKATDSDATAFFDEDGNYVVRDNSTHEIIQINNRNDPNWIPDESISKPYRP